MVLWGCLSQLVTRWGATLSVVCLIRLCVIYSIIKLFVLVSVILCAQEDGMYRCRWQTRVFEILIISDSLASNLGVSGVLDA